MRKIAIYLAEDLDLELERFARERGVSKAEVIRTALRRLVEGLERPLVMAIGVSRGPGDVGENVDRHLRETGFGS